jgi:hypothetical protein
VLDERSVKEARDEGIPEEILRITGQPSYDSLGKDRVRLRSADPDELRKAFGMRKEVLSIAFVSQPPMAEWARQRSANIHPGFDRDVTLPKLISALEELQPKLDRPMELALRPHPREATESFTKYHSSHFPIRIHREGNSREFSFACDLVTGMDSSLLLEACLIGSVVLCVQIESAQPDRLPCNRWGLSRLARTEKDMKAHLEHLLTDAAQRTAMREKCQRWDFPENATANVVKLARNLKSEISFRS